MPFENSVPIPVEKPDSFTSALLEASPLDSFFSFIGQAGNTVLKYLNDQDMLEIEKIRAKAQSDSEYQVEQSKRPLAAVTQTNQLVVIGAIMVGALAFLMLLKNA